MSAQPIAEHAIKAHSIDNNTNFFINFPPLNHFTKYYKFNKKASNPFIQAFIDFKQVFSFVEEIDRMFNDNI